MPTAERYETWASLKVGFCWTGTNGSTVSTFLASLVGCHGQLVLTNGDYFDVEITGFHQGLTSTAQRVLMREGYDCTYQQLLVRAVSEGEPRGHEQPIAFDLIESFNIY